MTKKPTQCDYKTNQNIGQDGLMLFPASKTPLLLRQIPGYATGPMVVNIIGNYQRWSRGHKARGQGQGHKKIRGQGQPFRGQTLSRPRTGMLEAKAKDQGHKRKCSPKKKKRSSQKFFKRSPKKKVFSKIFQAISKKKKKKKVFTKIFQAISTKKRFPNKFSSASQNFNNSKNSAVLEPRTGQFSRTSGLEAKAKDLTFEAKAKDFKMCPRGQGRPRGLHLW